MKPFRALVACPFLVVLLAAGLVPGAAPAQPGITAYDPPRNAEYERRTALRRLQSELVYIDRLEGEIPMDGVPRYRPPDPQREYELGRAVPNASRLLLAVLAVTVIGLAIRFGGPVFARYSHAQTARGSDGRAAPSDAPGAPGEDGDRLLDRLRLMDDREAALVLLIKAVLAAAAAQNGLRLGRAETARELVRRIPEGWRHIADLRRIVMTEELVQFGGRALAVRSFEDCLTRARPILAAAGGRS